MGTKRTFKESDLSPAVAAAADRGEDEAVVQVQATFDHGMTAAEYNRFRWAAYREPAEQGDTAAQYWLGFLYATERRDATAAVCWYERAAKQGHVEAMKDLATGYSALLGGAVGEHDPVSFGRDAARERYWLERAAEQGDEESRRALAVLKGE